MQVQVFPRPRRLQLQQPVVRLLLLLLRLRLVLVLQVLLQVAQSHGRLLRARVRVWARRHLVSPLSLCERRMQPVRTIA